MSRLLINQLLLDLDEKDAIAEVAVLVLQFDEPVPFLQSVETYAGPGYSLSPSATTVLHVQPRVSRLAAEQCSFV